MALFNFLHNLAGRGAILDLVIIFFAKYLAYILVAVFIWLVFKKKTNRERIFYFSFGALSTILSRGIVTEVIRFFYDRPRPFEVFGFDPLVSQSPLEPSFPSGHAALFFALGLVVYWMSFAPRELWYGPARRTGVIYLICAVLMGLARVASGVHWPSDILGGAVVGLLSAYVVKKLIAPYSIDQEKEPVFEEPKSVESGV